MIFQGTVDRLFSRSNLRLIAETEVADGIQAQIFINDETGSTFFVHGATGIAFNPRVGAWSAPLDFSDTPPKENVDV